MSINTKFLKNWRLPIFCTFMGVFLGSLLKPEYGLLALVGAILLGYPEIQKTWKKLRA